MKGNKNKGNNDAPYALVYSTDPPSSKKCPSCGLQEAVCRCSKGALLKGVKPNVRIEKKGRGGKAVTIIEKLPGNEQFLKELSASLKKSAGCGGTYYVEDGQGIVEMQGERREQILDLLAAFQAKQK
jgi:translation initiation factor 1